MPHGADLFHSDEAFYVESPRHPSYAEERPAPVPSPTSATDPRLLSNGDNDEGGTAEEEEAAQRYADTSSVATYGDDTVEDLTLEEPEITLAHGGSTLGGHISSFDEDLTLPNGDAEDERHTPIVVSTGVKSARLRFENFAADSSGAAHRAVMNGASFDEMSAPQVPVTPPTVPVTPPTGSHRGKNGLTKDGLAHFSPLPFKKC